MARSNCQLTAHARTAKYVGPDAHGRVDRIYALLAAHKLAKLDVSGLRGVNRFEETIVRAARFVIALLQRPEQRLSKHIQVHSRSRARPPDRS